MNKNRPITVNRLTSSIIALSTGGLRILGNGEIVNSTISGSTSTTWHGGALFLTDGEMNLVNSTVVANNAPAGTTGGLFTGTFGESSATLNINSSIVANNGDFGRFLVPFGAGPVAINSLGNNVFTDGTCNPIGSDQIVADAGVDAFGDNGGPTQTHAVTAASPAIDAANAAACPVTDQRGVVRPQGPSCDVGAYEWDGGATGAQSGSTGDQAGSNGTVQLFLPLINQ